MDPGDVAALASLVGLSGALAVGALVTVFLRRASTRLRLFEGYVITVVLAAAGLTAAGAIGTLHRNAPSVSSGTLTQIAVPLLAATLVVGFFAVFARMPDNTSVLWRAFLSVILAGCATSIALSTTSVGPKKISVWVAVSFLVGAVIVLPAGSAVTLDPLSENSPSAAIRLRKSLRIWLARRSLGITLRPADIAEIGNLDDDIAEIEQLLLTRRLRRDAAVDRALARAVDLRVKGPRRRRISVSFSADGDAVAVEPQDEVPE